MSLWHIAFGNYSETTPIFYYDHMPLQPQITTNTRKNRLRFFRRIDHEEGDVEDVESIEHVLLDFHQIGQSTLFDAVGLFGGHAGAESGEVGLEEDDLIRPVAAQGVLVEGDELFEGGIARCHRVADPGEEAAIGDHQTIAIGGDHGVVMLRTIGEEQEELSAGRVDLSSEEDFSRPLPKLRTA